MVLRLFALFASGLTLSAVSVWADENPDADLPAIGPPGIFRILTQSDSTTTSQCIGKPITPLCAVETYLACRHREIWDLCLLVSPGRAQFANPYAAPSRQLPVYDEGYRVIAALKFTDKLIPPTELGKRWAPGDVGITIEFTSCRAGECKPPHFTGYRSYVIRLDGGQWRLIFNDSNRVKFTKWPPPNVNWDE